MTRADLSEAVVEIIARARLTARDAGTLWQVAHALVPTEAEQRDQRVTHAMSATLAILADPDDVVEMIRRLAEDIGATTETTAKIADILDREIP